VYTLYMAVCRILCTMESVGGLLRDSIEDLIWHNSHYFPA
jgi:hypothetical protein